MIFQINKEVFWDKLCIINTVLAAVLISIFLYYLEKSKTEKLKSSLFKYKDFNIDIRCILDIVVLTWFNIKATLKLIVGAFMFCILD